jgi:hypothetical protein
VTPMRLLESGIPLSLLLDLVMGPESADLLDHERLSAPDGPQVGGSQASGHRAARPLRSV